MRRFNAPAQVVEALRRSIEAERDALGLDVFPENWHAVQVFFSMGTQWRTKLGARGLLYEGLDLRVLPIVLAEHRGLPNRQPLDQLMPQLRTLEAEALPILNRL